MKFNYFFSLILIVTFINILLTKSPLELDLSLKDNNSLNSDYEKCNNSQSFFLISNNLSRIKENLYTIKVKIGYPEQEFNLIVDTGSFISWVES